jgi:hypothetical protein
MLEDRAMQNQPLSMAELLTTKMCNCKERRSGRHGKGVIGIREVMCSNLGTETGYTE